MKRRLFNRIFSAFLCLTMAVCLVLSFQVTGYADQLTAKMDVTVSNAQYYDDGSLKSVVITTKPRMVYGDAYGKFAIHIGNTPFGWNNRYPGDGSSWVTPTSDRDPTFVTFGERDEPGEFEWTDTTASQISHVTFPKGMVPAGPNRVYQIVMWTRSTSYGIYPDALVGTLKVDDGKTTFNGTEVTSNGATPPSNELVPETAPVHTHHWVVTGDNTDTLTASCTGTVGTCDLQSVSVKLSASSVTLPDSPYNAVISGAEGFQSQTGLKIQPLADKGRAAYKFKAVGADHFTDLDLTKAEAGTDQAIVYVTDDDGVTHSAFVEYTAIDPVKTAATGDNRPIELMVLGLGMFCAMAAACFTLDRKHR